MYAMVIVCNYRPPLTTPFNCSLVDTAVKHTPRYQSASKVEHITTCQFGLLKYKRYTHTTTILFNNNSNIDNDEDIIFTDDYNEDNGVIVLSDQEFLDKTSTNSIHSSEDDVSTQTIIPESVKGDMLEFWDDEEDMLPVLEKQTKQDFMVETLYEKKRERDS